MEKLPDKLGSIVKEARLQTGMTRKEFAVKVIRARVVYDHLYYAINPHMPLQQHTSRNGA
jgi:ribosome-binding protein aMBF1 (putative translation factor)